MKKVAVIMGSASDIAVAQKAVDVLRAFEVPFAVRVLSAHRTAEEAARFAQNAKKDGFGALIAIAGMAAHLAGALAGRTTLPVIGVPASGGSLSGLDALLATVQMPSGVPVATVALDGGKNAALLAIQMLALSDAVLDQKLVQFKETTAREALQKDREMSAEYGL